ncbi:hybrid-cluster NAD(P)-dependent oxidoreductase [Aliidongia dinghuensis]|uniref:Hybrid-cluster NAD(P)-dependent oxidoreductase n=1 Tax=Aliidongia dinghuensis TaxID=1867774 RepID=A0A8J2YZX8_9PROT|nr:hybrid-cluster NAD(P)-dependent oxidoreductase [Aliidongia dinghuensis]GGF43758.1 hybrid-cluster NAD(P)-dependent oxidoreductase [Aliidongia dinghuensis]
MAIDDHRPVDATRLKENWDPELDDRLLCVDIHQETHDVKTFTFVSPAGKHFDFHAGQYFLFDLDLGDAVESRCYSISSSPHRKNAISITVKRVAGGRISNWLHDTLTPNATVQAKGPLGAFLRPSGAGRKFLFLSGGSGITPVMSIARDLADLAEPADVVFVHAARSPRDIIFRDELALLANRVKGFRLFLLPEDIVGERSWPGLSGRISKSYVSLAVPDVAERIVMCCGPAPFMKAARDIVAELGVPAANYLQESFDEPPLEDAPIKDDGGPETQSFRVDFAKQARTIEVPAGQTVLSHAKRQGIRLPSSCANGLCGTCKSKLVSGTVDMHHNGGIRQREIDAGWFLPCCSKPLSDLVVDR